MPLSSSSASSSSSEEHSPLLPHKREVRFLELQKIASSSGANKYVPSVPSVPSLLAAGGGARGGGERTGWLLGPGDVAGGHAGSSETPFLP